MSNTKWTQEENLAALKLFAKFKKACMKPTVSHPEVRQFASDIHRTCIAVMMRLGNYEYYYSNGLHGLKNGGTNLRHFYDRTISTVI